MSSTVRMVILYQSLAVINLSLSLLCQFDDYFFPFLPSRSPRFTPVSKPPVVSAAVPKTAGRAARAAAPAPAVVTRSNGLACRGEGVIVRSRNRRNFVLVSMLRWFSSNLGKESRWRLV
eukprot:GFUD01136444.1.p1 GENE.GFUD01136444.1~~GFUD01136444.1.p1  ORF type:complete len:119 (+),score=19.83 GFUD01136444.1:110-466(+)